MSRGFAKRHDIIRSFCKRTLLLVLASLLLAAPLTFGPVSPPSGTDDGYVRAEGVTGWPSSSASGSLTLVTNQSPILYVGIQSGPTYHYYIPVLRFDTSALPDGATVESAVLSLRYAGGATNLGGCQLGVGWYSGAWSTAAFVGYDTADTSAYGPVAMTTLPTVTNTRFSFTLVNPAANVSKTGWTQLRMHMWSCPPTTVGQFSQYQLSDMESGSGGRPELTVTYTPSGPKLIVTHSQD